MKLFPVIKLITVAVVSLGLVACGLVLPTSVEAATLYYSPSSANLEVGGSWTVRVMVNTAEATAAIKYTVTFPSNILSAQSATCGSKFSTPVSTNIANGSISGDCAALGQGNAYTGSAGEVAVITFKAIAQGTGKLGFGVSTIVRNGGDFGNMYTGGGSATVTVSAPAASAPSQPSSQPSNNTYSPTPTPAPAGTSTPTISSSSHPEQEKWYTNKSAAISWTGVGTGYNFEVDQSAGTQLATTVKSASTSTTFDVAGDGVWYAHVRANGPKGWSNTGHYKIQIDTTAPTEVALSTTPESPMSVLPTFTFSAKDAASGIDYYELKIDDGEWMRVASGYKPKQISSGEHTATVRAVDKAGHKTEKQAAFTVVPLATPQLTTPSAGLLRLGEAFTVAGTAEPNTSIEIYINDELKETVTVDAEGNFESSEQFRLFPGDYKVAVKAVNKDGITSAMSDVVMVTVDAQAVSIAGMILPGWGVYSVAGMVFVLMLLGLLWLGYRVWRQANMWMGRVQLVEGRLDKEMLDFEQRMNEAIDTNVSKINPGIAEAMKEDVDEELVKFAKDVDEVLKDGSGMLVSIKQTKWQKTMSGIMGKVVGLIVAVADVGKKIVLKVSRKKKDAGAKQTDSTSPQSVIPEVKDVV